ncbi:MAG TPA: AAA family ATPase [Dongiaceae bacterium]|nr:AAA family ATPase [Dongiaceae bacterium]
MTQPVRDTDVSPAGRVVILNGAGSVGKSSIAKELQHIASAPYLHVQMDAFLDMLPEANLDHPDGLIFTALEQDGRPAIAIQSGPVAARAFRGMRHAVAAMAAQGNNLIVDDVMLDGEMAEYVELLAGREVFRVGLFAPLDVIEARESQRGDRMIGLARWQYDRVHRGVTYDLEIKTADLTPRDCARMIKERFQL